MKMTGMKKEGLLQLTEKIITTLGENGSVIHFPGSDIQIPAAKVSDVVDPTGAGDAYRAGLLKGMTSGRDIETSARMGAVAAVYAIEHYGTQEHAYTYEELVSDTGVISGNCERNRGGIKYFRSFSAPIFIGTSEVTNYSDLKRNNSG